MNYRKLGGKMLFRYLLTYLKLKYLYHWHNENYSRAMQHWPLETSHLLFECVTAEKSFDDRWTFSTAYHVEFILFSNQLLLISFYLFSVVLRFRSSTVEWWAMYAHTPARCSSYGRRLPPPLLKEPVSSESGAPQEGEWISVVLPDCLRQRE